MANSSMIVALGEAIAKDTRTVEDYFRAHNLPTPSFDADGPQDFNLPTQGPVLEAYERTIDNANKLHLLMIGPSKAARRFGHLDAMASQAIYRLKIAQFISEHGPATFQKIADSVKVKESIVRRILRYAMTNYIFCEDPPGIVKHSSLSRRLAEDSAVRGAVGMLLMESFPGSARAIEPLIRNGDTQDPMQCGWVLANNASAPLYQELDNMLPERAGPVADAMGLLARITPVDQLLNNYPWASLGQATVVDIGGGRGPVAKALATRFPNLTCVVQDLELTVRSGRAALEPELADRVSFMQHDFFKEQPVQGADVYFFRYILHDWPEEYGIRILQALIPAFKVGSRVVLHEFAIPDQGTVSDATYKFHRHVDLNMMVYFNGQERELSEWETFLGKVSPRLKFTNAYHPKVTGSEKLNRGLAIVEAVWTG